MDRVELSWRESQDMVLDDAMSMTHFVKGGGTREGSWEFAEIYAASYEKDNYILNIQAIFEASEIARETRYLIDRMVG